MTGTHTSSSYLHGGPISNARGVREDADGKKEGSQAQAKKPPDGEIRHDGVGVRRRSGQSALHRNDDIRPRLPAAKVHPRGLIRSRAGMRKAPRGKAALFLQSGAPKGGTAISDPDSSLSGSSAHHCHWGRVRLTSAVVVVVAAEHVMSGVHLDRGGRCRRRVEEDQTFVSEDTPR